MEIGISPRLSLSLSFSVSLPLALLSVGYRNEVAVGRNSTGLDAEGGLDKKFRRSLGDEIIRDEEDAPKNVGAMGTDGDLFLPTRR